MSSPGTYAAELARATGRFYTQGMPEDTKGLKTGVLTASEFLQQARIAADETERQYRYVLDRFTDGFLFYYFGNVDQVSHMMWRAMDPQHPAYDPDGRSAVPLVVEDLYAEMDAIVGRTLAALGPDDLLVVMSDHGFVSWRRAFNLNTWLRDNGYLALRQGRRAGRPPPSTTSTGRGTRAYGLGLNGLYVNLRGREHRASSIPARGTRWCARSATSCCARSTRTGHAGGHPRLPPRGGLHADRQRGHRPDLIVGYAKGTRASDESALGGVTAEVIVDNAGAWTGDHCMDPDAVPGILLTTRPLRRPAANLRELAPALLAELGIDGFPSTAKEH